MDIIKVVTIIYFLGIVASTRLDIATSVLFAAAVGSGVIAALVRKSRAVFTIAICLFAFLTSLFLYKADDIIDNSNSLSEYLIIRKNKDAIELVNGTALDGKEKKDGSYEFLMSVNSLRKSPGEMIPVKGKLIVRSWGDDIFHPEYGDAVSVEGWIQSASSMKRKSSQYLRGKGINGRMRLALNGERKITGKSDTPFVMSAGKRTRDRFLRVLSDRVGGEEASVMGRMLLGKEQEVSDEITEAFRRAGLSHVLVVSGMHVGFMMGAFLGLSFLWSRRPVITFFILSCVLVFYFGLTGGGPSITRATIMGFVFLAGLLRGSGYDAKRAIFIAALLMMVMEPLCIFNIGVQLTFLASAGVIYLYPLMTMFFTGSKNPNILLKALMVSISAQLPLLPVLAYYFNNFCAVSPVSNVVVVPLISILLPLTFLTCLAGLLPVYLAPIATALAAASKLFGAIVIKFTFFFSSIEFGNIDVASPSPTWIALYEVAVILFAYALWQSFHGTDEKSDYGFYGLATSVVILSIPFIWNPPFTGVKATFIDVGEGDSTFVEIRENPGKTFRMLVDAGGSWGYSEQLYDPGERAVGTYLKKRGVRRLDALVLSHPEADHMNGLLWIADNIKVENFLDTGIPKEISCRVFPELQRCSEKAIEPDSEMPVGQREKYEQLLLSLKNQGTRYITIRGGSVFETGNGGVIKALSPDQRYLETAQSVSSTNNFSAVLKIQYGDNSLLLPGDIERPVEKRLMTYQGNNLDSTILKSPHHGSATSSSLDFIQKVSPDIVVVSTGGPSFYGHPNKRVVENYISEKAGVFRTDQNGTVTCLLSGRVRFKCSTEIMD